MIWALILLQVTDAVSTVLVLRNGGTEKNPLLARLMGKIGVVPALLALKIPVTAFAVWAYQQHPLAPYFFAPVLTLYVWVVAHNVKIYRRLIKD